MLSNIGIPSKGDLIPNEPVKKQLAYCSILISIFYNHKLHSLMKAIFFRFLSFQPLAFYLLYCFYTSNNNKNCFKNSLKSLIDCFKSLIVFSSSFK